MDFDIDGAAPVQLIKKRHSEANSGDAWFDEIIVTHPNQTDTADVRNSMASSDDSNDFEGGMVGEKNFR